MPVASTSYPVEYTLEDDYRRPGPDEDDARRVSDLIDEDLKKESARRKDARKKEVKVMLLGQAESGKSTLQKQFQIQYQLQALEHERPSWRPVIYFNVIKALRVILDELDFDFASPEGEAMSAQYRSEISALRSKLLPVVAIEDSLASELSGGVSISGGKTGVYVRSGWQGGVSTRRQESVPSSPSSPSSPTKSSLVGGLAARSLNIARYDIEKLWRHPAVSHLFGLRKLKLEESATFFLDDIHRVAEPDYLPTTDDILNVRLQTLGVIEHSFDVRMAGTMYNWLMYDVGGARGQRHAWIPFFEATAIIFLAPISAFDQYLEEDPRTNRIDDSLQLFTTICSNKLLKKSNLVLMLNKTDLLKKKLKSGVKIRKFITSYGDRPNTFEEAAEYFRAHFIQVHRRKDVMNRPLYAHFTSMLDVNAMQSIIINIGEAIIRSHIASTGLA